MTALLPPRQVREDVCVRYEPKKLSGGVSETLNARQQLSEQKGGEYGCYCL